MYNVSSEHKELFKEKILNKERGIYGLMITSYPDDLSYLQPSLFLSWMAMELKISEEKMNRNSLYSAIARRRKLASKNQTDITFKIK